MRWRLKSAGFKLLSAMPGGRLLYGWVQERVTQSTLASRSRVEQKIGVGIGYWDWLKRNNRTARLLDGTLLDLGAGWHPTIPLLFHSLGARRQILLDVQPLMSAGHTRDTLRLFREIAGDPGWPYRHELRRLPGPPADSGAATAELIAPLGMEYIAPYQGRYDFPANSADLALCTQAMQHIPKPVQLEIFRHLHRALKPGGLFLATVHLVGHFANPHATAGQYEHLKPSPRVWENLVNSSLMSFNRLKAPDYREQLLEAGFRLGEFEVRPPTAGDLADFSSVKPHRCFERYSAQDLAARHLFFVAEKP